MNNSVVAILGFCVAVSLPAHATLMTANASDYAIGTEMTHAFEGLTIRAVNAGYENPGVNYDPTYVVPIISGGNDTGLRTFNGPETPDRTYYPFNYQSALMATHFDRFPGADCSQRCDAILIDLDQPTDYVKVMGGTVGDRSNPYESMFAAAFDADWNYLAGCYSLSSSPCATVGSLVGGGYWNIDIEFSRTTWDISHIVAGGQRQGWVDGLTYNRGVPEPGTFGLLFLGLIGVAISSLRPTGSKAPRAQKDFVPV